jgi:uncharacterized protein YkwD
MARLPLLILMGAGLLLALSPPLATPASAGLPRAVTCPNSSSTPAALTVEQAGTAVACEINHRRKRKGLRWLVAQLNLAQAASEHTEEMVENGFFSHLSLDGTNPIGRILESGYIAGTGTFAAGENLRWGTGAAGSPQATVAAWMQSPTHRHAILDRRWRHIGIGVVKGTPTDPTDADSATYTVEFGFRRG